MSEETLIKVLAIGDTEVGKTSLILRYISEEFHEKFISTIGIDFSKKHIIIEDEPINYQIWDTAGQENFFTITKNFYRNADGILLVYSVNNESSFRRVKMWMDSINDAMETPIEIFLVGNQCDTNRVISTKEGQKMADLLKVPFFETSAKTGENVDKVFTSLAFAVKKRIEKYGRPKAKKVIIEQPKNDKSNRRKCCN